MTTTPMLLIAMISLGALTLGGCEDKPDTSTPDAPAGTNTGDGAATIPTDPIGDAAAAAAAERDRAAREAKQKEAEQNETNTDADKAKADAVEQAEQKVGWFRTQLDAMKAKSKAAAAATNEKWDAAVVKAEQSYDAAKTKLAEVKDAGAEAWKAAKPELDEAVTQLNEAYEKAKAAWNAKLAEPTEPAQPGETPKEVEPTK